MATVSLDDLLAQAARRLDDVQTHSIPSLHDVKTLADQQDRSAEARSDLALVARYIEEAELEAFESEDERTRLIALGRIESLREQLDRTKAGLRSALLQSKKRIDASGTAARAELFRSPNPSSPSPKPVGSKEDALMGATSDVADTLHRSLNLMRQELERSVLSTQMLEQQTALMSSTSDSYTSFGGLLDASKSIISSMERADVIDRLVLGLAMLFFLLVCLYILKKRILDRGIRLVGLKYGYRYAKRAWENVVRDRKVALPAPTAVSASLVSVASSIASVVTAPLLAPLSSIPLDPLHTASLEPLETTLPVVQPTTAIPPDPTPTDFEELDATIMNDDPPLSTSASVDASPPAQTTVVDEPAQAEAGVEADGFEDVPQEDLDSILDALFGDEDAPAAASTPPAPARDEL